MQNSILVVLSALYIFNMIVMFHHRTQYIDFSEARQKQIQIFINTMNTNNEKSAKKKAVYQA